MSPLTFRQQTAGAAVALRSSVQASDLALRNHKSSARDGFAECGMQAKTSVVPVGKEGAATPIDWRICQLRNRRTDAAG